MNGCEKVFHTMKEKGMDLAVLLDPADIKYVSGFEVPFWPAWMGDVSNGLPMVTAIVDAKREQIQLVASDMQSQILINAGRRRTDHMSQTDFLTRNPDPDHTELLSLKFLKILMIYLFQKLLCCYSSHSNTSYLLVMSHTT